MKTTLTPAERQRKSRARRKAETFETFPAMQLGLMLSAQASMVLRMLANYRDMSQKEVIEQLLIEAYEKSKA